MKAIMNKTTDTQSSGSGLCGSLGPRSLGFKSLGAWSMGAVLTIWLSACATGSPTKVGADQWQLEADNYIEGARAANNHCKSLGMNVMKVIKREAHEDTITLSYQCLNQ